jgi:hypothetical protein
LEINKYIRELLLLNDCVIIPGLGGFVTRYQPAMPEDKAKKIYPPSKSISFNRQLQQNDGLLINHLSHREDCSYRMAEEKVQTFVKGCARQLAAKGIIILPEIGKLFSDKEGNIEFAPAESRNYLAASYGLKPASWHKLYEEIAAVITDKQETTEVKPAVVTVQKRKRRVAARLAVNAAMILVIITLIAQDVYIKPLQLQNLGILNLNFLGKVSTDKPAPAHVVRKAEETKVTAGEHSKPAPLMPSAAVYRFSQSDIQDGYYLVLGSFADNEKAQSYIDRQRLDNELLVLNSGTGKYRVATYVTTTTTQAVKSLEHFRTHYRPDVWLMYNQR